METTGTALHKVAREYPVGTRTDDNTANSRLLIGSRQPGYKPGPCRSPSPAEKMVSRRAVLAGGKVHDTRVPTRVSEKESKEKKEKQREGEGKARALTEGS